MDEHKNHEEGGPKRIVDRYEHMLQARVPGYFDVYEFEHIVDHYLDVEDYALALQAVSHAIEQHPSSTGLMLKKAQVLAESGKPGEGLNFIHRIERIEQANPDLFLLKGSILSQLGKIRKAEYAFRSALNACFDDPTELLLDIALVLESVQQYQSALSYLDQAMHDNPGKPNILYEIAYCQERLNNFSLAKDHYRKYLDEKPFNADGWFNLGMLCYKTGEYTEAIDCFEFTMALNDKHLPARLNRAASLVNLERYTEAAEAYSGCLELDDRNPGIHTCLGECFEKLEDWERSVEQYKKALGIDSGHHEAWYGIGVSMLYMRKLDDSLYYLNKAIHLDKDNPDYWFTLGNVQASRGSGREALKAYTKVENLDPGDFEAWINHARLEFNRSGPRRAIAVLKESYTHNHEVALINYHLAAYYYLAGEEKLCLRFFEIGMNLNRRERYAAFGLCSEMEGHPKIASMIENQKRKP